MRKIPHGVSGFYLVALLLVPLWAQASSFQVNPIRLTLSADHSTDVVTLTNDSHTPTEVQLVIVAWNQEHGKDIYTPTRNLLATPPIFTIPSGKQQIVRVGMRTAPNKNREMDYRLFFTEVPPPPTPGFRGLRVALRIGIPVFVDPAVQTKPILHWTAKRLSEKHIELTATNSGNAHIQLLRFTVDASGHGKPLAKLTGNYILPGSQHSWSFKLSEPLAVGTDLEVSATTDKGRVHAQLVLDK